MIALETNVRKKMQVGAALIAGAVLALASASSVNAADAPANAASSSDAAAQLGPAELVTKVAQDTLKDLDAHRSEYKNDSQKLRALVDKNLLPYFDTSYAGQLVLGKYWRGATPQQRKRFVDAFYQSLLQTYGEALTDFTPDRLKILPFQGNPQDTIATVRSEVRRDDGSKVAVNYSLHKTSQGWKAYDVQISGVSYVKSMRTDFGSEVQQRGLEAVIQRLESQVSSGKPAVSKPESTNK
jgi:phospholipid transport system substrate-binding protein